jgi:hypothetical protein
MERFLTRFKDHITGIVSGPDRLLLRGTLRSISHVEGLERYLKACGILHKEFVRFAQSVSIALCQRAEQWARQQNRPCEQVRSARVSKEDYARFVAEKDGIKEGLVCVLSAVERCQTFRIRKNRETKKLDLVPHRGQCKHLYFYFLDREFGLMHVRLQTWIPFTIQVCLNGRSWLGKQLQQRDIPHCQQDNCFTSIGDLDQAQALLNQLPLRRWVARLNAWARRVNPWLRASAEGRRLHPYYWSTRESEYATDVMFRPGELEKVYPALVRHAIDHFHCENVLRFLAKRVPGRTRVEVRSHWGRGPEGVRVKHWVAENSIKMYDKKGTILRVETTINNARRFKVRRRNSSGLWTWMPLRKGICDFRRRMNISRAANAAYLDALATVVLVKVSCQSLDPLTRPVRKGRRHYRPLRPIHPQEAERLQLLARDRFLLHGVRNRDLRPFWPTPVPDDVSGRATSARISRWLCLVKAHGLLRRLPHSHRYKLTAKGHQVLAVVRQIRQLPVSAAA